VLVVPLRNVRDDGILFEQKKSNGEMRVLVEWTDALRAAVAKAKALPRPVSGLYLVCNRRGQPYTDAGFKTMWNRLQVQWKDAGNERFWFRDLRAKAITDMKEQGRDAKEVSGHKNRRDGEPGLRSPAGAPRPRGQMILEHLRRFPISPLLSD
jgi:hypothetical protein